MKATITEDSMDDALWFPENYHWGPSETKERGTQGGGTAVWDQNLGCYVFKQTPEWWLECMVGDPVPKEWGII